jgi:hypothetical protein
MFPRFRIAIGLALLLAFVFTIPVLAGGWAIITLDEMPADVVAGEPFTIGFTVLQHGQTPVNGLTPTITANLYKEQEFTVNAEPDGKSGHYTATLTFPKEGEWRWSIQAFNMDRLMPILRVSAPLDAVVSQPVVKSEPMAKPVSMVSILRLSALGVGLVGLAFAFRRKNRFAAAVTAVCLLIGLGSFVAAPAVPAVEAQSESISETVREPSSVSQVEWGGQLFVAKGCVTCHANNKLENASEYKVIGDAPDLTKFSASPEALRLRLKDPASVKSDTWMPDLNLSDAEIEALIMFINSK